MEKKLIRILVVEDEQQIARVLELELTFEGYEVVKTFDGREGLEAFSSQSFDLVLLDIMLPGFSGLDVLRRIRHVSTVPVIMITARDTVQDKVAGLDLGANDYITKPFAMEEVLARIRATLRDVENEEESDVLTLKGVEINETSHTVSVNGTSVELTKREFDLLLYLFQNRDVVLSRETLLNKVWGYDYQGETNVVDVYIRYLRSKIDQPFDIQLISTVRGVGYVVRE